MGFLIKCWDVLKHHENFQKHSHSWSIRESYNATYIALIPKKNGAKEQRDISLIDNVYKLMSKVLTLNRKAEKSNKQVAICPTNSLNK